MNQQLASHLQLTDVDDRGAVRSRIQGILRTRRAGCLVASHPVRDDAARTGTVCGRVDDHRISRRYPGAAGGVFRGTIVQFHEGQGFFVADAFWLPPDGEPIGPMALEVQVHAESPTVTRVRVTQTGFEEGARWRRHYEVVAIGWSRALASMKALLER